MNNSQAISHGSSTSTRHPGPRTVTQAVALPTKRSEHHELRDLLEANLQALQALHDEHRRMIHTALRATDASNTELRDELRAVGSPRAPWVHAMTETRALLFVALRELIVGPNEAELSMHLAQQTTDADEPAPAPGAGEN